MYVAPELEVLEVMVEAGFSLSNTDGGGIDFPEDGGMPI